MSESSFGSELEFYEELAEAASEEICALDAAVEISGDIIDDLQESLNTVMNLSAKYDQRAQLYSDTSCIHAEYLTSYVEPLINEARRKHDLNSPQQHHKVQEINDGSGDAGSIINHPSEAQGEEVDLGGGGDGKSSDEDNEFKSGGFRSMTEFWNRWSVYHKVNYIKNEVKGELNKGTVGLQQAATYSKSQSAKFKDYAFKPTRPAPISAKSLSYLDRSPTSSSLKSVEGQPRPSSEIMQSKRIDKS